MSHHLKLDHATVTSHVVSIVFRNPYLRSSPYDHLIMSSSKTCTGYCNGRYTTVCEFQASMTRVRHVTNPILASWDHSYSLFTRMWVQTMILISLFLWSCTMAVGKAAILELETLSHDESGNVLCLNRLVLFT